MKRSNCLVYALREWLRPSPPGGESYLLVRRSRINWGFVHFLSGRLDPRTNQIAVTSYVPDVEEGKARGGPWFFGAPKAGDWPTALMWSDGVGWASFGATHRTLNDGPAVDGLPPLTRIAYQPGRLRTIQPEGEAAREMTDAECRAALRALAGMDANAQDALDGGLTLAVVVK